MGVKLRDGVYTAVLGLVATGAIVVWPDRLWIGYTLFAAAGLLLLWGLRIDNRHLWQTHWLSENLWWRFSRGKPSCPRCSSEPAHSVALGSPAIPAAIDPAPRPSFSPVLEDGFEKYPEPKALLRLRIDAARGTRDAGSDGKPTRMSISAALSTVHDKVMRECSVDLVELRRDGQPISFDPPGDGYKPFDVRPTSTNSIRLISRNLEDTISKESFRLRLGRRNMPLAENSQYLLLIELRSRYPHPTVVHVQIDTGEDLDAQAVILSQVLAAPGVTG